MFIKTLFVLANIFIFCKGQLNLNFTNNEIIQTCTCMKYWKCIENDGIVYSSCGLLNICCLFGKPIDKDELDYYRLTSRLIKKEIEKKKKLKKKQPKNVSNIFDNVLNNNLNNNLNRSSRRKSNGLNDKNKITQFSCGKKGQKSLSSLTVPGEYPWHAAVLERKQNLYLCGGSLIANNFILTAAHCLFNLQNSTSLKVRLGEHDISRNDESELPFQEILVRKIIIHPNFSRITLDNDIALLQLNKPVNTNRNIQKVCLPSKSFYSLFKDGVLEKLKCYVTGWGKISENQKHSLTLKEINVPIWNKFKCSKTLEKLFGFNLPSMDSIICAGDKNLDACIGDGGGPLVCESNSKWFQLGIVSFGIGCGRPNIPGVYTDVINKSDWIQKIINKFNS